MNFNKERHRKESSTALTAVALQDHLVKSLGLNDLIGPRHVGLGPAARAKQKKTTKSTIDTGRFGRNKPAVKKKEDKEKEYVLDPKPPPLSLAQRFGLVDCPDQPLTETDWQKAKEKSNKRDDSKLPCVICKEDFGTQEQVLLSCTHVFHRACLQAFERFTGKKTCPMCRKEQYQTRVIHEGSRYHRHKCATMIQACWRGYVVRCMYQKLREANPPKDPKLRKKFYEEKLHKITDRMVRSVDFDVHSFLREMDQSLAASRNVFRDFDARFQVLSDEDWETIQLKAVERGEVDCPICLTSLVNKSYIEKQNQSVDLQLNKTPSETGNNIVTRSQSSGTKLKIERMNPKSKQLGKRDGSCKNHSNIEKELFGLPDIGSEEKTAQSGSRRTVLLSCSHVFHETCLAMFEELSMESSNSCPVCRTKYQKKTLNT